MIKKQSESTQFNVADDIKEIQLTGEKLEKETSKLDLVNKIGYEFYINNRDFIKEHIPENWYAVIEPISGKLIASDDQMKLYKYTSKTYPNKIFYFIGLLKINIIQYVECK